MNNYNDFAINFDSFEQMAKDYNSQIKSKVLKIDMQGTSGEDANELFNKIEFLRVLVDKLKNNTSNTEILIVLNDISNLISEQLSNLIELFHAAVSAQSKSESNFEMFCNNLKLAISTTSDIIRILIKIKDDNTTKSDAKQNLTNGVNAFLDVNNQLVSLFGECRYLKFKSK